MFIVGKGVEDSVEIPDGVDYILSLNSSIRTTSPPYITTRAHKRRFEVVLQYSSPKHTERYTFLRLLTVPSSSPSTGVPSP